MTAIDYDAESSIVTADDDANVQVAGRSPGERYVEVHDPDGTIRLIPFTNLDPAERELLTNRALYEQTRAGLTSFQAGQSVSSDWLFDGE